MGQPSGDIAIASLPAILDLTAAGPLTAELLGHRGISLMVDGSGVERVGAQCMQVLLAARATWIADGQAFSIDSPSQALTDTAAAIGAADLLFPATEEKAA